MTTLTTDEGPSSPSSSRLSLFAASQLPASERRSSWSSSTARAPSVSGQSDASASSSSNVFRQTSAKLQSFMIESIISASAAPPRLPVSQTKEPLSLPTTTKNFRGFVQKSGPIFWFQDGVQATLVWQDTSWTLMWMGIWAVISVYPWLLVLAPSTVLSIILIMTHQARFDDSMNEKATTLKTPVKATKGGVQDLAQGPTPAQVLQYATDHPTRTGEGDVKPALVPNPPHEGTIKYYENLRDIQNMMRLVIDGYDAIAPAVPYLNWSSYSRTLHIFQCSILVTIVLFFAAPYIPWRLLMFVGGEGAFVLNHPWTLPALQDFAKKIKTSREGRKILKVLKQNGHTMRGWIEQDRLDDHVWEQGWRNVEMFENERYQLLARTSSSSGQVSGWSAHNLHMHERRPWTKGADGWAADELDTMPGHSVDISRQVAMKLEPGWEWVGGDDWRIDWGGSWSSVGVDDEGYVYTDSSWQKPSPYAYGHGGGVPDYPPSQYEDEEDEEEGEEAQDAQDDDARSGVTSSSRSRPLGRGVVDHDARNKAVTRRRRWLRRAVRVREA